MLYNKKAQPLSEKTRMDISRRISEQLTEHADSYEELVRVQRAECKKIADQNKESISLKSDMLTTPFI